MWVVLRDITTDKDIVKELPVADLQLEDGHEYIIADYDGVLEPNEFDSIAKLNEFLKFCEEHEISSDTLAILSKVYFYKEVVESVMSDNYSIVNFTEETVCWNNGHGGSHNDEDKGRCLFESGRYAPPFEVTKEMADWIDWAYVWTDANCHGWTEVSYRGCLYLVWRG